MHNTDISNIVNKSRILVVQARSALDSLELLYRLTSQWYILLLLVSNCMYKSRGYHVWHGRVGL